MSDDEEGQASYSGKKGNILPIWGNDKTMNMNSLILTNIQASTYFKVNLYKLKTYHEVIDEIYYNVSHLEPWEKGSRRVGGQTGMCGGVRGVGAGGIVSTAFCILYKLYTLKLTRKQLVGLLNHCDSPYIRGVGFMYIRYTQPPQDLFDWFQPYFDDEEEIDVRAGGGTPMTIGEMVRLFLTKLDWYSTLFPRIPVPVQKDIEMRLRDYPPATRGGADRSVARLDPAASGPSDSKYNGEDRSRDRRAGSRERRRSPPDSSRRKRSRERERSRERPRSRERDHRRVDYHHKPRDRSRDRSRDRVHHRSARHESPIYHRRRD